MTFKVLKKPHPKFPHEVGETFKACRYKYMFYYTESEGVDEDDGGISSWSFIEKETVDLKTDHFEQIKNVSEIIEEKYDI